jgi:hypothetical protein
LLQSSHAGPIYLSPGPGAKVAGMARSTAKITPEHVLLTLGLVVGGLFVYHRYHGGGKS